MARTADTLRVEVLTTPAAGQQRGSMSLEKFTCATITNDLTTPAEAAFEIGNDGTWDEILDQIAPGATYKVFVNDCLRLTGRVELNDNPVDSAGGSTVRFTVRTKLADAAFASANPKVAVQKTTLAEFMFALYKPLGFAETSFQFNSGISRDLMTGLDTKSKTGKPPVDFEKISEEEARVSPSESIFDAADRHLRRHGLMHWDSADGDIVIGQPDDAQPPRFSLRYNRKTNRQANNVLSATRTLDYGGIPSHVMVCGMTKKRGSVRDRVAGRADEADVIKAGFYRPVIIISEGVGSGDLAARAALRELSARSKRKDALDVVVDGLSFWDGHRNIPWAIDTVALVDSDVAGIKSGAYYIHRVELKRDPSGDTTTLSMVKKGIWKIS